MHHDFCALTKKKRVYLNLLNKREGIISINYAVIKFENPKFTTRIHTTGRITTYGKDDNTNRHYAYMTVKYLRTQGYKDSESVKTSVFLAILPLLHFEAGTIGWL